jgi:hypothetical protein
MVMDKQEKRTLIFALFYIALIFIIIFLAIWFFSTKTGVLIAASIIGLLTLTIGFILANIFQCIIIFCLILVFIQLQKTNKLLAEQTNIYLLHGLGDTVHELRQLSIKLDKTKRAFRRR